MSIQYCKDWRKYFAKTKKILVDKLSEMLELRSTIRVHSIFEFITLSTSCEQHSSFRNKRIALIINQQQILLFPWLLV